MSVTTDRDRPDAITLLADAFDGLDDVTKSHILAVRALRRAPRPLAYAELTRALNLSGRQARRVVRDLEAADVVERHEEPRGSPEPDRFELSDGG